MCDYDKCTRRFLNGSTEFMHCAKLLPSMVLQSSCTVLRCSQCDLSEKTGELMEISVGTESDSVQSEQRSNTTLPDGSIWCGIIFTLTTS